jgi:hypothetical protein
MADRKRRSQDWECFTCGGCTKTVRRRRPPNPTLTPRRCLCCSFLDTVPDVRLREALRTVLEPGGGLIAEPRPNRRFNDQADAPEAASPHRP